MRLMLCLLAALPVRVYAQTSAPTPPRESVTVGATLGPGLGNTIWLLTSLRVSVPLGPRVGLDVDAGRVLGSRQDEGGTITEYGALVGAQVRILRRARASRGTSQYWLLGPLYIRDSSPASGGRREHLKNFRFGYGWDHLTPGGRRVALEVGLAGGEGPVPYANLTMQWGPGRPR